MSLVIWLGLALTSNMLVVTLPSSCALSYFPDGYNTLTTSMSPGIGVRPHPWKAPILFYHRSGDVHPWKLPLVTLPVVRIFLVCCCTCALCAHEGAIGPPLWMRLVAGRYVLHLLDSFCPWNCVNCFKASTCCPVYLVLLCCRRSTACMRVVVSHCVLSIGDLVGMVYIVGTRLPDPISWRRMYLERITSNFGSVDMLFHIILPGPFDPTMFLAPSDWRWLIWCQAEPMELC